MAVKRYSGKCNPVMKVPPLSALSPDRMQQIPSCSAGGSSHDGESHATGYAYGYNAPAGAFCYLPPANGSDSSGASRTDKPSSFSDSVYSAILQAFFFADSPPCSRTLCCSNARKASNRFSISENLQSSTHSFSAVSPPAYFRFYHCHPFPTACL